MQTTTSAAILGAGSFIQPLIFGQVLSVETKVGSIGRAPGAAPVELIADPSVVLWYLTASVSIPRRMAVVTAGSCPEC